MSTWNYLLYINDLLNRLESTYGLTVGTTNCGNPTLADDLVLLCPDLTSLEHQLTITNDYANDWGYSFNTNKCKFIIFGKSNSNITSVRFGNSTIYAKQ